MTTETWKPVLEFSDTYEVSNLGQVRRTTSVTRTKAGYILKPSLTRDDYLQVELSRPKANPVCRRILRLVWEAFQGPIPKNLGKSRNN